MSEDCIMCASGTEDSTRQPCGGVAQICATHLHEARQQRDEWKRKAGELEEADRIKSGIVQTMVRNGMEFAKALEEERDALAVQNDVLRYALKIQPHHHTDGCIAFALHPQPSLDRCSCHQAENAKALALTPPRAAEIAEARKRFTAMTLEMIDSCIMSVHPCDEDEKEKVARYREARAKLKDLQA